MYELKYFKADGRGVRRIESGGYLMYKKNYTDINS